MSLLDEDSKNRIGTQLTSRLAQALKDKEITLEEQPAISATLLTIDTLQTTDDLLKFLEDISKKWSIFSNHAIMEKARFSEKQEDVTVKRIENLIKENKLDQALSVAHSTDEAGKEDAHATATNAS